MEILEAEFDGMTALGAATACPLPGRGRDVLAWGVLPGERARVAVLARERGHRVCRAEEILRASPDRIAPREPHYLSCSPWQTMEYRAQAQWKRQILEELFSGIPLARFEEADPVWGYRNKLEFCFIEEGGRLRLAFHERASPFRKLALREGCQLGTAAMNVAALELTEQLAQRGVGAGAVKSLVVRGSRATGEVVLALYVMEERFPALDPALEQSAGIAIAFSDPLSPASVPTRMLSETGRQELTERVAGLDLAYPIDAFFQNHVPMFERAIAEIRRHVPEAERVVELYSGVGSIGLALADRAGEIVAVESSASAVNCAERNRDRNGASNYHPRAARVESVAEETLSGADVVVLDPPRTGLGSKLVGTLLRVLPARLVYLSCHPPNQARDVALLGSSYRPTALVGFDFYPQTPHIESLVVLDRRSGAA
ncbi:MAG TPA: methyltransferase [Candidatus Acidoferrales bacterium]|nr:methyltransferase [Candidatus Acidoferrales bacterium]